MPDVIVKTSVIVTNNAYRINGTEYQVGYGQEFGLECKTSSFFRSEWLFESGDPGKSTKILNLMVNNLPGFFFGIIQFLLFHKTVQVCMTTLQ